MIDYPDSFATAMKLTEAEFLDSVWSAYQAQRRKKDPPDFNLFTQIAARMSDEINHDTQVEFSWAFWGLVFEYDESPLSRNALNGEPPQVIYERGFWKPVLYEALTCGFFDDWREALLYMHLSDRYCKRGEFLDGLIAALYAPAQKFDLSEQGLRREFERRSQLLPVNYRPDQPQMTLF